MLIMQHTKIDFQGLADKIAASFLEKGTRLEDSIIAEARRLELNPEEVRRLVEKTNTACSIAMMRSSEDKKRVFELAEKERVLAETHPQSDSGEEYEDSDSDVSDSADSGETASENTEFEADSEAEPSDADSAKKEKEEKSRREKTASVASESGEENRYFGFPCTRRSMQKEAFLSGMGMSDRRKNSREKAEKKETKEAALKLSDREIFSLQKSLEETKQAKIAAELSLQKTLDVLCSSYRGRASDFHKLASDFMSANPESCAAVYLRSVSDFLGAEAAFVKEAGFVDDTSEEMRLLYGLEKDHAELCRTSEDIAEKESALAEVHDAVRANSII